MKAELRAQNAAITDQLDEVSNTASNIADTVGASYDKAEMATYEAMLDKIVMGNDNVLGSGLWFEPYAFDSSKQYMGPYIQKADGSCSTTYDYSNESYDYFSQDYYKKAKEAKGPVFTDPYYDKTSGLVMSTCSCPIFNKAGKYIGCVTVDISLDTIQKVMGDIKIGTTGNAMLLTAGGVYLYSSDRPDAVKQSINISNDTNKTLAAAGSSIIKKSTGTAAYIRSGANYNLYYDTIQVTGWKLVIQQAESEIMSSVRTLTRILIFVCVISLIVVGIFVILLVNSMTKKIKKVQQFSDELAKGNFTIKPMEVQSDDEIGRMSKSLNEMYAGNGGIVRQIAGHARELGDSSEKLSTSSKELTSQFGLIEKYMTDVNEAMMSTSAATEEVNASAEEVNSSVSVLAEETAKSTKMSDEIKDRAGNIEESSQKSYNNAINLSEHFTGQLKASVLYH